MLLICLFVFIFVTRLLFVAFSNIAFLLSVWMFFCICSLLLLVNCWSLVYLRLTCTSSFPHDTYRIPATPEKWINWIPYNTIARTLPHTLGHHGCRQCHKQPTAATLNSIGRYILNVDHYMLLTNQCNIAMDILVCIIWRLHIILIHMKKLNSNYILHKYMDTTSHIPSNI